MILCDLYINGDVVNAVDTPLTAAIVNNMIRGTSPADWDSAQTIVHFNAGTDGLFVGASQIAMQDTVKVRSTGIQYIPGSASKAFKVVCGPTRHDFGAELWENSSVHTKCTVGGYIYFGAPDIGAAGQLHDFWKIENEDGDFCVLQLSDGKDSAPPGTALKYGIGCETNPSGVTTHTPMIVLTPQTMYWCALNVNWATGACRMAAYTTGGSKVGEVAGTANIGATPFHATLTIGQDEVGNEVSTSYFQHVLVDYTGTWPFPQSNVPPWRTGRMSAVQRMT